MIDIEKALREISDRTGKTLTFKEIANKKSQRADLHAFLLLDQIMPQKDGPDLICSATHDQIFLDFDLRKLGEVITQEQLEELSACGVFVQDDALSLFV
jgi:hypothetical protein